MELIKTGIPGLDTLLGGGIPKSHVMLLSGYAGSGKTTLGMQFLCNGTKEKERGLIISVEQSENEIRNTMDQFGWGIEELQKEAMLTISSETMVSLRKKVREQTVWNSISTSKHDRFVLDSISVLEHAFEKEFEKRKYILNLISSIKELGATALLVVESDEKGKIPESLSMTEYLCDGVIKLLYPRVGGERVRAIEIVKSRGMNHMKKLCPMKIGEKGISVYPDEEVFMG